MHVPAISSVLICRGVNTRSFMIQIWMGKTLANGSGFTKFAKVFPRHCFVLYSTCMYMQTSIHIIHWYLQLHVCTYISACKTENIDNHVHGHY